MLGLPIRLVNAMVRFPNGSSALQGVTLSFSEHAFTAVIGPSGSGKSTMLRLMNGLLRPTAGQVYVGENEIGQAPERLVRQTRRQIGMVFQQFNLVRRLSALENVLVGRLGQMNPLRSTLRWYSKADLAWAMHLLERVGMAEHAWQRADTLSGGQQQRVGIARALAQRPRLILADEPISALDPKTSEQVMELLLEISREDRIAVICNLHHLDTVSRYADRVVALRKGQVFLDGTAGDLSPEVSRELYYGEAEAEEAPAPQEFSPV
ncbi:MAG: phosphonate ABC transporter ATP-binding protein [Meiothermus sp.]|uniref:phosphonate ABC transporter ATP-binding protein n=1 Tax=Meiothermus sp. TaxID=1955249 RepID=UPI0025D2FCD6|nr:phosphonate ABC transporter ATP-binding protein [Meiothermus sp.]MCS7068543.1 phosphonate ABC transporter ATP-binding protein [Meiothermus sp.]MCX7739441.1 phosphonate ABC transporter ATP-binding protein [Meiothermus sp.]MDW8425900.1 phosphonate ABC transporter ATP-binding protein [Meiothermus sp.]